MTNDKLLFFWFEGRLVNLDPRSHLEGVTVAVGPLPCGGCGEDLVDGPCRLGRVECWACGRHYPLEQAKDATEELDLFGQLVEQVN